MLKPRIILSIQCEAVAVLFCFRPGGAITALLGTLFWALNACQYVLGRPVVVSLSPIDMFAASLHVSDFGRRGRNPDK
jgi:hypothetical protein